MNKTYLRILIILVIALISIFFSWKYVNTFIFKSRADAPKYNISISSRSSQPMVNEDIMLDLVISTSDPSNNHISAFQFDMTNSLGEIVEVSQPASILANGSSASFIDIDTVRRSPSQVKIAFMVDKSSSQLPSVVSFSVKVRPTSNGTMTVGVSGEQVVGDINEYTYERGSVDTISFNIQPPTAVPPPPTSTPVPIPPTDTPIPTSTPVPPTSTPVPTDIPTSTPTLTSTPVPDATSTPIPTSIPCRKSQGDVNCDNVINSSDFDLWLAEFSGQSTAKDADFNGDGKVDLIDFEIWRNNSH